MSHNIGQFPSFVAVMLYQYLPLSLCLCGITLPWSTCFSTWLLMVRANCSLYRWADGWRKMRLLCYQSTCISLKIIQKHNRWWWLTVGQIAIALVYPYLILRFKTFGSFWHIELELEMAINLSCLVRTVGMSDVFCCLLLQMRSFT